MSKIITYDECKKVLSGERLPAAFVDLDAFDSNLEKLLAPKPHQPHQVGAKQEHGALVPDRIQSIRICS